MDPVLVSSRIRQIEKQRYEDLKWSDHENLFRNRIDHIDEFFVGRQVPFSLVSYIKLRRSLLGTFLETYNYQQHQNSFLNENKLSILEYNLKNFSELEKNKLEEKNDVTQNVYDLLRKAVKERGVVEMDFVYEHFKSYRILDTPMTFIDEELKNFKRLKVLVLCGNWIGDINGFYLPRCLEYLELFGNRIRYLRNFAPKAPKHLIHLGFRRNNLANDSGLHLLSSSGNFQDLRSLDLSDNEISDLLWTLQILQELKSIYSLQLEGNPCYVVSGYKDYILRYFPNLVYLDNVKILPEDRAIDDASSTLGDAAIIFTCHRILGLPAPPKEKGTIQKFYFEVSVSLLEEIILDSSVEAIKADAPKKRDKSKSSKSSKKSKKGKASMYSGPDEYKENERSTSFKTERFGWSKLMQLPEDALVIESLKGNYTDIRDTFRSTVSVKLIYFKTIPPSKKKKGKDKKKGKGKNKKGKKGSSKGSSKGKKSTSGNKGKTDKDTAKVVEEPKEIVLKKLTLADFNCDLHTINWSDKTIDFFWAKHPQLGNKGVEIGGSLRAFKYSEGGKKGKGGTKGKKPKKEKKGKKGTKKSKDGEAVNEATSLEPQKLPVPNILTIHIGFGLKRSYNLVV